MPEMRAGRTLSQTPGLCTLYLVAPGDDRKADECIGMVATPELAAMIVASVNGEQPQVAECQRRADERLADLQREAGRRIEARVRAAVLAEREAIRQRAIDRGQDWKLFRDIIDGEKQG